MLMYFINFILLMISFILFYFNPVYISGKSIIEISNSNIWRFFCNIFTYIGNILYKICERLTTKITIFLLNYTNNIFHYEKNDRRRTLITTINIFIYTITVFALNNIFDNISYSIIEINDININSISDTWHFLIISFKSIILLFANYGFFKGSFKLILFFLIKGFYFATMFELLKYKLDKLTKLKIKNYTIDNFINLDNNEFENQNKITIHNFLSHLKNKIKKFIREQTIFKGLFKRNVFITISIAIFLYSYMIRNNIGKNLSNVLWNIIEQLDIIPLIFWLSLSLIFYGGTAIITKFFFKKLPTNIQNSINNSILTFNENSNNNRMMWANKNNYLTDNLIFDNTYFLKNSTSTETIKIEEK